MVSGWVFPGRQENFLPTVQIDMVALPDQVKAADQPALDPTLPVKDAPPPLAPPPEPEASADSMPEPPDRRAEMALQKERDAQKEAKKALERLRQQVKRDQKAEDRRREELIERRQADLKRFEEAYRSAIRGNQTNQGTSMTGEMKATMNAYAGRVVEKVRSNWALPAFLQGRGLQASLRIYIDARGNLARYQFSRMSGNEAFDNYVKGAVQKSSPFAPPPEEMARGLRNSGLELDFPL